jgi:hypothetical protein
MSTPKKEGVLVKKTVAAILAALLVSVLGVVSGVHLQTIIAGHGDLEVLVGPQAGHGDLEVLVGPQAGHGDLEVLG